jgi:hypothetical protein
MEIIIFLIVGIVIIANGAYYIKLASKEQKLFKREIELNHKEHLMNTAEFKIIESYKKPITVTDEFQYDVVQESKLGVDFYTENVIKQSTSRIVNKLIKKNLIEISNDTTIDPNIRKVRIKLTVLK